MREPGMVTPEVTRGDLIDALERADRPAIKRIGRHLPTQELSELLLTLDRRRLQLFVDELGNGFVADEIAQLDPAIGARILGRLTGDEAADVLEEMPPEHAADVVGELGDDQREHFLSEMEHPEAAEVRELLAYPPNTAGGRMTTHHYEIKQSATVAEALAYLRTVGEHGGYASYLYVVDDAGKLMGVAPLNELVISSPDRHVSEFTKRDIVFVEAATDQEMAAKLLRESHLLALPVCDDHRLVGVVTADDMADVLVEEASEDIERLGGSQPLEEPYLTASVWHLFRKRVLWLLALFAAEAYTGSVLRAYEDELSAVVALAFFIPLLIGTGGNTGSQTVTMLVRAIAVGEVQMRHLGRVITREVAVAMMLGVVMAVAAYARSWTLGVPELGEVVALTALCIVVWAAFVAAMLPLVLKKLRVDPAVVSAPLITTLVDGTGLIIYFNIAKIVLRI